VSHSTECGPEGREAESRVATSFEGNYVVSLEGFQEFDISGDGKKFVMIRNLQDGVSETRELWVILNWFEELNSKFPVEN
jgi:hypothetical protein